MPKKKTDQPEDNNLGISPTPGSSTGGDNNPEIDLNEFFQVLEKQVNAVAFDEVGNAREVVPTEEGDVEGEEDLDAEPNEVAKVKKELESYKKRYEDSSSEAKRIASELDKMRSYEGYIPLLEEMRRDPNLINHVRNYLEGRTAPRSLKEEFNLPEDFVFDSDEAISNPESHSAKILGTLVDRAVEQRLRVHTSQQQVESKREAALRRFQDKLKLSDDEVERMIDWSKTRPLTFEDIYYLMNRENREKEIARRTAEEITKKRDEMSRSPHTLANKNAHSKEAEDEDRKIFNMVKKAGGVDLF